MRTPNTAQEKKSSKKISPLDIVDKHMALICISMISFGLIIVILLNKKDVKFGKSESSSGVLEVSTPMPLNISSKAQPFPSGAPN